MSFYFSYLLARGMRCQDLQIIQTTTFSTLDEEGGTWKPVLISAPEEISDQVFPKRVNSTSYQEELAALRSATAKC